MSKPLNPVYGFKKQPKDNRDFKASFQRPPKGTPPSGDLRGPNMPKIWDQSTIGSCTAHGIGRIYQYAVRKAGLPDLMPSRLFLYYNERRDENTISFDAGAIIRDGIKTLNKYGYGIVDESYWPYDVNKFTWTPPQEAYDAAKSNTIRYYASLDELPVEALKLCIAHGYPFVFGFDVYKAFEDYTDGVLDLPNGGRCLGGHCVAAVGYDDAKQAFLVANSWGEDWGIENGHFMMSYDYMMSNLVSDKWMLRLK
jgi:C1A family cysteine protease